MTTLKKIGVGILIALFFIPWATLALFGVIFGLLQQGFLYGYYGYMANLPVNRNKKEDEN